MFMAGYYRPPNKPLADFTQFIPGALECTNNYCAVFTGVFNVYVMNHSSMARNYIDGFHQYSFVDEIILSTYISPSDGNATSSIDYIRYKLNSSKGC